VQSVAENAVYAANVIFARLQFQRRNIQPGCPLCLRGSFETVGAQEYDAHPGETIVLAKAKHYVIMAAPVPSYLFAVCFIYHKGTRTQSIQNGSPVFRLTDSKWIAWTICSSSSEIGRSSYLFSLVSS